MKTFISRIALFTVFCLIYFLASGFTLLHPKLNDTGGTDLIIIIAKHQEYIVKGRGCNEKLRLWVKNEHGDLMDSSNSIEGNDFSWNFTTDNWPCGKYSVNLASIHKGCTAQVFFEVGQ